MTAIVSPLELGRKILKDLGPGPLDYSKLKNGDVLLSKAHRICEQPVSVSTPSPSERGPVLKPRTRANREALARRLNELNPKQEGVITQ